MIQINYDGEFLFCDLRHKQLDMQSTDEHYEKQLKTLSTKVYIRPAEFLWYVYIE